MIPDRHPDGEMFFRERANWIHSPHSNVTVHETSHGHEIRLLIDGYYSDRKDAEEMASYFRGYLLDVEAGTRARNGR